MTILESERRQTPFTVFYGVVVASFGAPVGVLVGGLFSSTFREGHAASPWGFALSLLFYGTLIGFPLSVLLGSALGLPSYYCLSGGGLLHPLAFCPIGAIPGILLLFSNLEKQFATMAVTSGAVVGLVFGFLITDDRALWWLNGRRGTEEQKRSLVSAARTGSEAEAWSCPKCDATNRGQTFECEACQYRLV